MGVQTETDLLAIAERLCERCGQATPIALSALTGGKNNRVYRVSLQDDTGLVLKCYHSDPRDPRDRLGAEWTFLTHIWERGVRNAPKPLAQDQELHAALYTFIPGEKLSPGDISIAHMAQASAFIVAANAAPRDMPSLNPGSEACFSLSDHIATVDRRVARLDHLDTTAPFLDKAQTLVKEILVPHWLKLRTELVQSVSSHPALLYDDQCISPSDFGFHNALLGVDGELTFIDFEYAGRDDPAKLVCDFFCCPEIPVPLAFRSKFIEDIAVGLGLDTAFSTRCEMLLDAYRIKWTCIILNEFLQLGAARRDFALADAREARCALQLDKAVQKLSEIGMR